jgi:hypothetical protein
MIDINKISYIGRKTVRIQIYSLYLNELLRSSCPPPFGPAWVGAGDMQIAPVSEEDNINTDCKTVADAGTTPDPPPPLTPLILTLPE